MVTTCFQRRKWCLTCGAFIMTSLDGSLGGRAYSSIPVKLRFSFRARCASRRGRLRSSLSIINFAQFRQKRRDAHGRAAREDIHGRDAAGGAHSAVQANHLAGEDVARAGKRRPPRIGELNLNPPIPSTWKFSLFMIFATKDWMQGWELHRPSTWPSSSDGLWSCVRP